MPMRPELMEPCSTVILHTSRPFFSVLVVPSLTPTSWLQLQIPYQPTKIFKFLVPLLKLFIPFVEAIAPRGAGHCPVRLKRPFAKVGLPFLILHIFASLLTSFSPGGSPKRPPKATFSITPWLTSGHFPVHALVEPQLCKRFPQIAPIVHTPSINIGLRLYLGSQSICIMGFGFPTMGGSMLRSPNTPLFPQIPLFTSHSCSPSFLEWSLFSLNILSRIASPFFSFSFLIYSVRSVGMPWLFLIISGNGGPIPLCLSGYFVESGSSGIGTDSHLQKDVQQRYSPRPYRAVETCIPEHSRSYPWRNWPGEAQNAP